MPKTKTIDGLTVTCVSIEPADALDLLPELAPVIGALIGSRDILRAAATFAAAVAEGRETDASKVEIDVEPILRSMGQVLGHGKVTELLVLLLRTTAIGDGQTTHRITDRATFNLAFAGRMWSAFTVAAFAFEVTYGNFSDVVSRLPGVVRAQVATAP